MNKILIGIITCNRDREWLAAARETWIKDIPSDLDHVFVDSSFAEAYEPGFVDSYETLPLKTRALCKYAFANGYRAVLKTDVDTYIRPKMLRPPSGEFEYGGRVRGPSHPWPPEGWSPEKIASAKNVCQYCSGGIYWLTKRAIQVIAEAELTADMAEDRWVGNVLYGFGIYPLHMVGYVASTLRNAPPTDYLKSANTIALMNVEEPDQMRRVHRGIFDVRTPAGSQPKDFPAGSQMRSQMR